MYEKENAQVSQRAGSSLSHTVQTVRGHEGSCKMTSEIVSCPSLGLLFSETPSK